MRVVDKIAERIGNMGGVISVLVIDQKSQAGFFGPEESKDLLGQSVLLVKKEPSETFNVKLANKRIIALRLSTSRPFVKNVEFPVFDIAVMVVIKHQINKSIQRALRSIEQKYCNRLPGTLSSSRWREPKEPPAHSSVGPLMGPSSPSPGVTTQTTGGSQEGE